MLCLIWFIICYFKRSVQLLKLENDLIYAFKGLKLTSSRIFFTVSPFCKGRIKTMIRLLLFIIKSRVLEKKNPYLSYYASNLLQ